VTRENGEENRIFPRLNRVNVARIGPGLSCRFYIMMRRRSAGGRRNLSHGSAIKSIV